MPKEIILYSIFLLTFIFINFTIYFLIQLRAAEKIFRKLCIYWFAILIVVLCEAYFVEGKLALSLVYLLNFVPIALMAHFIFEMYDYKFNIKKYYFFVPLAVVSSIVLNALDAPFYLICLSPTLVIIAPMVEFLVYVLMAQKHERQIEKFMITIVSLVGIFSAVYYCLYRYNPTHNQYLIGFGSAFLSYMVCAVLLPILCIKVINRKKLNHLEEQVSIRTQELSKSKQEKETLLRVLVHDISNPIQAMMLQLNQIRRRDDAISDNDNLSLNKVYKNISSITDIIGYVREYESILSGKKTKQLEEVLLQDCLNEVEVMFTERFQEKNIKLRIFNKLHVDTKIKVVRTPFIHSVASNLVSNALKFSNPNSEVTIAAYSKNDQLIIEVIDNGIGMSKHSLTQLFDISLTTARPGTIGETGTGFGLTIAKAYTNMFGGDITVTSSQEQDRSGTTVSLVFPLSAVKAPDLQIYLQ